VTNERFDTAIAAIDAGNADDPNVVTIRGRTGPKEVLHAELVSEWVARLQPDADDALRLAARGHHFRRWTVPRSSAPAGRAGYLRWRKARQQDQARELGAVLAGAGYDADVVERVQALVRKENLAGEGHLVVHNPAARQYHWDPGLRRERHYLAHRLAAEVRHAQRACIG